MLPYALASKLNNLSLNGPVERINHTPDGWKIETATGTKTVDTLVLSVGTTQAARLVNGHYPALAKALLNVVYPPMTAIHSAYKRADVGHPLNGFGGLNPKKEGRFAAGHIWSSSTFDGRCPADEVLITTFVGGMQSERNARLPDDVLAQQVHQELAESFAIRASEPVFRAIQRWERAIPQYDANIVALKAPVKAAEADKLFVCANWYGGLSLSDCIQKARKLAGELV